MARAKGVSDYRTIGTVTVTGAGFPDGFLGAADSLIKRLEFEHATNPKTAADALVDVPTFITGNLPFEGYGVTVSADFIAGDYTITYVETRPNATA